MHLSTTRRLPGANRGLFAEASHARALFAAFALLVWWLAAAQGQAQPTTEQERPTHEAVEQEGANPPGTVEPANTEVEPAHVVDGQSSHAESEGSAGSVLSTAGTGTAEASEAGGQPDNSAEETTFYMGVLAQAVEAFQVGDWELARKHFEEAHRYYPNARTLRGLGLVEFELEHYRLASEYLRTALASGIKPLTGELRAESAEVLSRAEAHLGRYEFVLEPWPDSAVIRLDQRVRENLRGQAVLLEAGLHDLDVRAPQYLQVRRSLQVQGGEDERVLIRMQLLNGGALAAPAQASAGEGEARSVWSSPWLWVGVGAVIIGGGIVAAVALSGNDDGGDDIKHQGWELSLP